jgi:hypothetical protein
VIETLPYAQARAGCSLTESLPPRERELEIQARLFHGDYGTQWTTTHGESFRILHFGEWNREAGPDFKGVKIEFERRGVETGDIEVDWDARDWENHGHALNPAFANTRLHFFIQGGNPAAFARSNDHREIPQARLYIENPRPLELRPPGAVVGLAEAREMMDRAAEFRILAKRASHLAARTLHGADEALFFSIAAGLGYKNNSIPFLLAAQRTGFSAASGAEGEAMLFGMAGFLEPRTFDDADQTTRTYLKPLWDAWWKVRDGFARNVLPRHVWKLSGIRPSNHPHRRLGALARVAREFGTLRKKIRDVGSKGFLEFFETLEHPYWSGHWNLSAEALDKPFALVGSDRAADLLINAYYPMREPGDAAKGLRELRGPQPSGVLRRASVWLVGRQENSLMRSAWDQQGLLQLHRDFGAFSAVEALEKIRA